MCNSQSFAVEKQTPIMASGPNLTFTPGQGTTTADDGLQLNNPGQISQGQGQMTPQQIGSQSTPTKLGTLLKFAMPILAGGFAGWAGGKSQGGGFNAAQNMFNQRRQFLMQQAVMQRQIYNDQFRNALELAKTQHTVNQPYFTGRGNQPMPAKTADGRTVFMRPNPYTGQLEEVQGYTPTDKEAGAGTKPGTGQHYDSDRGVMVDEATATARPILMENSGDGGTQAAKTNLPTLPSSGPNSTSIPSGPNSPSAADVISNNADNARVIAGLPRTAMGSVSPTTPGQGGGAGVGPSTGATGTALPGPGLPLGPKTKPNEKQSDISDWLETRNLQDTAANREKARTAIALRTHDAENNGGQLTGKAYTKRQQQLNAQLNSQFAQSEMERQKDLSALNKQHEKGDIDDTAYQAARQEIEEDNADRKQNIHDRMITQAQGEGIDLGTAPNYRAQLNSGGASSPQGLPLTPNGNKTAAPRRGTVRMYRGVPFVFNGKQYVQQQATR